MVISSGSACPDQAQNDSARNEIAQHTWAISLLVKGNPTGWGYLFTVLGDATKFGRVSLRQETEKYVR
jgi:hypothetical protein